MVAGPAAVPGPCLAAPPLPRWQCPCSAPFVAYGQHQAAAIIAFASEQFAITHAKLDAIEAHTAEIRATMDRIAIELEVMLAGGRAATAPS